jgi:hypothetical protein
MSMNVNKIPSTHSLLFDTWVSVILGGLFPAIITLDISDVTANQEWLDKFVQRTSMSVF